jgi:predicted nucleotidyltransferase component of viral defense system
MIPKNEILEIATYTNLTPHVVEKDYVLGWVLAGINEHPELKDAWVFKGGTCLKKCYFETYRFSEDLDFTLRDPSHVDADFLREVFVTVGEWIYDNSGIEVPEDRLIFDIYRNPRGVDAVQGRVYYRGPVTPAGKQAMPRIKLDLTADEILADTPVERSVSHEYSDKPESGIQILSYSYSEVFAEKIRALKERTRPRDLYDVINFFRRPESRDIAAQVRALLLRKCEFKKITLPTITDLDDHKAACENGWVEQLSHQLQSLPPFDSFWNELQDFFSWLEQSVSTPTRLPLAIPLREGEQTSIALMRNRAYTPQFSLLERIRFAAVNRLCVKLDYRKESGERKSYILEPYSLRRTLAGNIILYAVKLPSTDGHAQSFRIDRMISAEISGQAFAPRYVIDFIPDGPVNINVSSSPATPYVPKPRRHTTPHSGIQYFFKCTVCGKQFIRKQYDATLNPHKNKMGTPCYGRTGSYVKTKY